MVETEIERLVVRLIGDGTKYREMLAGAQRDTSNAVDKIEKQTRGLSQGISLLRTYALSALVGMNPLGEALSLLGGAFKGVRLAAQAEEMESSFGTMLQSAEQGRIMVAKLQEFASATPLNLPDLQRGAQTLLQFGMSATEIIPTLQRLGDTTGGNAFKLQSMVIAFGQMKSLGRLMGQELNQMINAGFNPLEEMSRTTGKSISQLKDEMAKGALTARMVTDAFKSATEVGGRFFEGMKNASRTLTGLLSTMNDDINLFFGALGKEIIQVFRLKELVQLVSTAAKEAKAAFESLSPEMKALISGIALAVAAAALFALAWPVLAAVGTKALGVLLGAIDILLGPINLLGIAVVGLAYLIVQELGGVPAVWEMIKSAALTAWEFIQAKAMEFFEWAAPMWYQFRQLAEVTWEVTKEVAMVAWEAIKGVATVVGAFLLELWDSITGAARINWRLVRDTIIDVLLFAEFTLRNFGDVAKLVWLEMMLGAVQAFNQIEHFLTVVIPHTIRWFADNWRDIFTDLYNWTATVFSNLGSNIVEMVKKIPELLKGGISFEDWAGLWKPLQEGFIRATRELVIPERVTGELERRLEKSVEMQAHVLGKSFEEFRKSRLAGVPEAAAGGAKKAMEELTDTGRKQEDQYRKLSQAVQKYDAALFGSAEALSRITSFEETLRLMRGPGIGGMGGGALPGAVQAQQVGDPGAMEAVGQPIPGVLPGGRTVSLLGEIRDLLKKDADRPPGIELSVLGLT